MFDEQVSTYFWSKYLLASLHWLPVKARVDFKVLLLTYKALHGLAPTYAKVTRCRPPYCP